MLGLTLIYPTSFIFVDIWLTIQYYTLEGIYVESQVVNVNVGRSVSNQPGGSVLISNSAPKTHPGSSTSSNFTSKTRLN